MEMGEDSVMVIHGGGIYGDKEKTIERWCDNYNKLPTHIKKRLVLENCERNFSIEDCLKVSEKVNIPVVFDTHHYDCYNIIHPYEIFDIPSKHKITLKILIALSYTIYIIICRAISTITAFFRG